MKQQSARGQPRALDLFCCAGGAAMGLHRAGFDVTGIDIKPQPRYPFRFIQADALNPPVRLSDFDFIWASPPCQAHVQWAGINREKWGSVPDHPDLIEPTRSRLKASGVPYTIENVMGAPLWMPMILCGSMFGLGVRRHRLFESSFLILHHMPCRHTREEVAVYGKMDGRRIWTRADGTEVRAAKTLEQASHAMGIDWMEWDELTQSIPPAYSEHIGRAALRYLQAEAA